MYSKTSAAILTSLVVVALALLFATGPFVADHALAKYYHHSHHYHHYS